jgi:hypothetical protein
MYLYIKKKIQGHDLARKFGSICGPLEAQESQTYDVSYCQQTPNNKSSRVGDGLRLLLLPFVYGIWRSLYLQIVVFSSSMISLVYFMCIVYYD